MMVRDTIRCQVLFVGVVSVMSEGLILESVKGRWSATVRGVFFGELDDGELLLLADVQLIDQLVV